MSWRFADQRVRQSLPLGASQRAAVGQRVRAGEVVANGTTFGEPVRLLGARRLGVAPVDLPQVMRVPPGAELERGAIIARTGRRFARALSAPFDGRIVHVRANGDLEFAPVIDRWSVRAALDGVVMESTDWAITIEGAAWAIQGVVAYGPDAVGELTLAVDGRADELAPSRIDVRLRDRILIGGGRSAAEAIARAHACGVAGIVTGAVPAAGLRTLFGDEVSARGAAPVADTPTVLCLLGFGTSQLPAEVFSPFLPLVGARAAIHAASARLFVFASSGVMAVPTIAPTLALAPDWGAVMPIEGSASPAHEVTFTSEVVANALETAVGTVPTGNLRTLEPV
ncbi:MAG: hypothetical protein E6J27_01620 [Chloroflexi bacterium]|nr:MAG: hypothetical protein E6J27_01620 [Chloroflexota bacterium]TMC32930.1 MAG: hypothetical protein E6J24_12090 [Chloroflexota bacterium]